MSGFNAQEVILNTFLRLRRNGFRLGMGELLAAYQALEGGFGENPESLQETLKILWCHSAAQSSQFESLYPSQGIDTLPDKPLTPPTHSEKPPEKIIRETPKEIPTPENPPIPPTETPLTPEISPLPVRAPIFSDEEEDSSPLETYYPLNRRSLIYNWRYLRRLVADGPATIPDIAATITQVSQQGFYLAPLYRKQERNYAHLVLLFDQNGSMTPFHRFSRDLLETARFQSSLQPDNVQDYYFHNYPASTLYRDIYLTEALPREEVLGSCDKETACLIISDAGAARGYRELKRIRATSNFLLRLQQHTSLIAWLNPMPQERWRGSSAEIIANLVSMHQMDNNGLSKAIDVLRGQ
jgi:uncharacterized protein with von Willebrand factor type A (vWA) domain